MYVYAASVEPETPMETQIFVVAKLDSIRGIKMKSNNF